MIDVMFIKQILLAIIIALLMAGGCEAHGEQISNIKANQIADAIFKLEGGTKTKWPYGIKSVKTHNPRQVCLNTIRHNWNRWQAQNSKQDFLTYLGDVYCPASCDSKGHANWIKNIHTMVK